MPRRLLFGASCTVCVLRFRIILLFRARWRLSRNNKRIYFSFYHAIFSSPFFFIFTLFLSTLSFLLSAPRPPWDLRGRRLRHWQESVSSRYDDGTRSWTAARETRSHQLKLRYCRKQQRHRVEESDQASSSNTYRNVNRNCRATVEIDTVRAQCRQ